MVLKSDGVAYLANGSTAVTSDERLKKNITDMADGQLAKINALKVRHFEWKDGRKAGTQTGVIAQEVETVEAALVTETEIAPDPDDTSRDFDGDVKIVKYGDINMRLLKAVQELSAKLDAAACSEPRRWRRAQVCMEVQPARHQSRPARAGTV